jgi:hypothetical protein
MKTRKVTITLTSTRVGDYEARSYPHDDINKNGKVELYKVPVYQIIISGTDDKGNTKSFKHKAPRFMPFWNDPKKPSSHYAAVGWLNAGLSGARTITVGQYLKDYQVQNRFSPGLGAIVLTGAFYIHGGPSDESEVGFGSAGCVEIIGNYDTFKANIASLSGSSKAPGDAIAELVGAGNLIVIIKSASAPNIKALFTREIVPYW